MKLDETRRSPEPIAIVGMACRMPGAANPTEFWHLLCEGQDRISCLSPERWSLVRPHLSAQELEKISSESPPCWGGFLSQVERFDAEFFGISPREATSMEPQHRLLLEVAWEAMEDAALTPEGLAKTQTGVFLGLTNHDYAPLAWNYHSSDDPYLTTGTNQSIAASRISYLLNLSGPCVVVDTACSSSLVAIHMACQSIRAGESTMAFAGGVNLTLEPNVTFNLASGGFQASDGRCKTFDSRADGYVRGEGAGVILLKPLARALADGDPIYASILGSAVNHDGRTQGITAPKPSAQEAVLRQAYKQAGISPSQVQYVEAHGTGTSLGDPIELKTLGKVLKEGRNSQNCCLVGAVKTNIGHLESAAGIAGLIKVALSLQHRQIPPNLHFQEPNPYIPFDKLPVKIPQTLTEWPS
ncbi:MAG: polyketide synthase, partial [Xenococcaceae cyanobacterium MO_234.B1]|nr:polyketide synthase [Xenococcaceae cyanobacterium MO_234.B1]